MLNFLRKWFSHKQKLKKEYLLIDTFGCTEKPPTECPTFLERNVHTQFQNALKLNNIIVVYGESRQGKTWTIERYCPNQIRIGCRADMNIDSLKDEMLLQINADYYEIEHTIKEEHSQTASSSIGTDSSASINISAVGLQMQTRAGMDCSNKQSITEEIKTHYITFDKNNTTMFIEEIRKNSEGKYFVFDNFHYLLPKVQQQFCTLLKEFNYHEIKIIIIGVWKETSRITALAPDLVNRCKHIDIGTWNDSELLDVLYLGEEALNIRIIDEIKTMFVRYSVNNIGIFKDFLQHYLIAVGIDKTQTPRRLLNDTSKAENAIRQSVLELLTPLHDRIMNLALPQRDKKGSKHLRLKIVIGILTLLNQYESNRTEYGFSPSEIKNQIDIISEELHEDSIDISNITQELGMLHQREENRQTNNNFISLFYYDKANKKLLILEPTLYVIKAYDNKMIDSIVSELKETIIRKEKK